MKRHAKILLVAVTIVKFLWVSSATADPIPFGTYSMDNRPGLFAYGLRLDALGTQIDNAGDDDYPDSTAYTFDVSGLTLTYSADDRIRISGPTTGGFGVVTNWTDTEGWQIDMTYENVAVVPADDDLWVVDAGDGSGTITRDNGGEVFALGAKSNGVYAFRLGDGDGTGKGDYDGIAGLGWLTVNGEHDGVNDFQFTASSVPDGSAFFAAEAGVALLSLIGFAGFVRLRRKPCR